MLRISALLLAITIFGSIAKVRIISHCLILISALHCLATLLESLLICHPLATAWDPSAYGTCNSEIGPYVTLEALGLLIDLAITVPTIHDIWHLQMSRRVRLRLIAVFSVGGM